MDDFSDTGYAYLGEQLASRGFIVISVDENFLNLSPLVVVLAFQSLRGVDDLRGWLLLEHLGVWREWNATSDNPFFGKVDLNRVALIGHSRGGQAVAAAAKFNGLPCYPDDASVAFDYGFGIRSVVGIAPTDGSYLPAEPLLPAATPTRRRPGQGAFHVPSPQLGGGVTALRVPVGRFRRCQPRLRP
jgi:hypothetical protein